MNVFDAAAVAAKIAQLRARPDADTLYYRIVIAEWVRWLGKLKEKSYEVDLETKEPFINIH